MKNNVEELVNNLPKPRYTEDINLICDSGAFNGGYLGGVLFYLQELEKRHYIKINKISGASVGSLLGTMYLLGKLEELMPLVSSLIRCYRESHCLQDFEKILSTFISEFKEDEYKKLNKRMYITYFDIENMKQEVISEYTSNNHLKNVILKSTFIPFFMNGKATYKGAIDGFLPYIFNSRTIDDTKILFIRLTQLGMFKKMLHSGGERNASQRISEGVLDAHVFYTTNKRTKLCSWVNYWEVSDYIKFRLRELFKMISVIIIFLYVKLKPYIPKKIFGNKYIRLIRFFLYQLFDDIFIIFYNS